MKTSNLADLWVEYSLVLWEKVEGRRIERDDLTLWDSFQYMYLACTGEIQGKGRRSTIGE